MCPEMQLNRTSHCHNRARQVPVLQFIFAGKDYNQIGFTESALAFRCTLGETKSMIHSPNPTICRNFRDIFKDDYWTQSLCPTKSPMVYCKDTQMDIMNQPAMLLELLLVFKQCSIVEGYTGSYWFLLIRKLVNAKVTHDCN